MNLYEYFGPADGVSHTALVAQARNEAANVTGTNPRDWVLESADYCHDEVYNEDTKRWEPEARIAVRKAA